MSERSVIKTLLKSFEVNTREARDTDWIHGHEGDVRSALLQLQVNATALLHAAEEFFGAPGEDA